jgi:hypothetical protein
MYHFYVIHTPCIVHLLVLVFHTTVYQIIMAKISNISRKPQFVLQKQCARKLILPEVIWFNFVVTVGVITFLHILRIQCSGVLNWLGLKVNAVFATLASNSKTKHCKILFTSMENLDTGIERVVCPTESLVAVTVTALSCTLLPLHWQRIVL